MQVERIEDMQVGDFIQLPQGMWHSNRAAQAIFQQARDRMTALAANDIPPKYQIENEPEHNARLERIR
jgi:hypothetical protein